MNRLAGKRVLLTQAAEYMGPAIEESFRAEGADVVASRDDLLADNAVDELLRRAGDVHVLVANLADSPRGAPATQIADAELDTLHRKLVVPLVRLVRGVLPQMLARKSGKIIAITSAAPLRGIPGFSAYCAARGAQNAFVRAVGLEVAAQGVHVNAIAQNYVKNPTYYPPELVASERFQRHVARNVPTGTVAESRATAELALYLAADETGCMVAQVLPFAGGWVTTTG